MKQLLMAILVAIFVGSAVLAVPALQHGSPAYAYPIGPTHGK